MAPRHAIAAVINESHLIIKGLTVRNSLFSFIRREILGKLPLGLALVLNLILSCLVASPPRQTMAAEPQFLIPQECPNAPFIVPTPGRFEYIYM